MADPTPYTVHRHHLAFGVVIVLIIAFGAALWGGLLSFNPDRARELGTRAGISLPGEPDPALKAKADEKAQEVARLKANQAEEKRLADLEAERQRLLGQKGPTAPQATPGNPSATPVATTTAPQAATAPTAANPRVGGFKMVSIAGGKQLKVWGWPETEPVSRNELAADVETKCPTLEAWREQAGNYPDGSPKYAIHCIRG